MITQGGNILYFQRAEIALYVVPKGACTSIKRCMAHCYLKEFGTKDWKQSLYALENMPHNNDYYKIAIVRNPWDRIASLYKNKIVDPRSVKLPIATLGLYHRMPFSEFVEQVCRHKDSDKLEKHFKSQYLTVFKHGPPDFIARVETLQKDWDKIQKLFYERSGKEIPDLQFWNKSSDFEINWTQKLVDLIAKRYSKDIELLGYSGPGLENK